MTPSVLLLIFNRPDITARTFAAIRQFQPSNLYVGADGPRPNHPGDEHLCQRARSIVAEVDWPCQVRTLFRSHNAGCRSAVAEAITWFFENETEGIILEDDCVPHIDFVDYTARLLERYRNDQRVMCVTGTNVLGAMDSMEASYFVSIYPLCWGWATWRRAWNYYDNRLVHLGEFLASNAFMGHATSSPVARRWEERFRQVRDYGLDSWATAWTFACWANSGLTCAPHANLVSNIGFGPKGTHTWDQSSKFSNMASLGLSFPLSHPNIMAPNYPYDEYVSSHFYEIDPFDQSSVADALTRNLQMMRDDVGQA